MIRVQVGKSGLVGGSGRLVTFGGWVGKSDLVDDGEQLGRYNLRVAR
jgi:hypothetical protein